MTKIAHAHICPNGTFVDGKPVVDESPIDQECLTNTPNLLATRGQTHGCFAENAAFSQELKKLLRSSFGWALLNLQQKEALEYIAGKMSRILSGNPNVADHWNDIAGYATLAEKSVDES